MRELILLKEVWDVSIDSEIVLAIHCQLKLVSEEFELVSVFCSFIYRTREPISNDACAHVILIVPR